MKVFDRRKDEITSVSKFLELNDSRFYTSEENPGKWMFRGESKFDYKLKPSIGRLHGNKSARHSGNIRSLI